MSSPSQSSQPSSLSSQSHTKRSPLCLPRHNRHNHHNISSCQKTIPQPSQSSQSSSHHTFTKQASQPSQLSQSSQNLAFKNICYNRHNISSYKNNHITTVTIVTTALHPHCSHMLYWRYSKTHRQTICRKRGTCNH
jgi:hypothetical protein